MRSLSRREIEVLALAARGCGNAAIARRLLITESTVKGHITRAMDALGVVNRTEAVVRWLTGAEVGYRCEVVEQGEEE